MPIFVHSGTSYTRFCDILKKHSFTVQVLCLCENFLMAKIIRLKELNFIDLSQLLKKIIKHLTK